MLKTKDATINMTELLKGDIQLTSMPPLFWELKMVLEDPNKSLADAGDIILHDPALTMRLLKLVNSAYYGLPERISTVTHAISIIGSVELQNLVLATIITAKFSKELDDLITMHDFWAMSLRSGLMAKEIAIRCHIKENKESIFICGLLHEIGKLVFYRRIPEAARKIALLADQTGEDEATVERKTLGFDHYDAGAALSRLWNLPEIISESIAQHCKPDNASPFCLAAELVRAANLISKMDLSDKATDLSKWGINDEELSGIIDKVNDQFEEIFAIFFS